MPRSVTEGIEALATTRVMIKPSGNLSDNAVTEHATKGKVSRSFSGAFYAYSLSLKANDFIFLFVGYLFLGMPKPKGVAARYVLAP